MYSRMQAMATEGHNATFNKHFHFFFKTFFEQKLQMLV